MASPAQVPPVRARHSFAGPVVLIILGVVFLMGTMGMLDWGTFGHWFAHYWPVLLIVWGIIKLLEYQQAQRLGVRPYGIGAGGVFLILLIIGFGIAASQASRVDWESFGDHVGWSDDDFFQNIHLFGPVYNFDDQIAQTFPAGSSLRVKSDRGNVTIQDSDDNQIKITVAKRLHAHDQNAADKYNAASKPELTASGNIISLNANTQGAGDHGVATDLIISLPRKASVTISTRHGDVTVNGREGDIDITSAHGSVSGSDIIGKISLDLDQASARLSQVSSDVSVRGHANDVSLDDVKGSVRLEGEFMESVKLANIAKPVTFKSPMTDIEFAKLDGDMDLDRGDLQANNMTGPLRVTTRSKDIRINGLAGDIRLQNENGTVEVHVSKLGSMQIENRQGDIQVYLPDKSGFQINASARNGEVQSDFADLKIDNGNDQATANGSVGGGGPHLVFNNEHGTIEIRKASSDAGTAPPKASKAPRTSSSSSSGSDSPQPTDN